jgi:hypothetical protein
MKQNMTKSTEARVSSTEVEGNIPVIPTDRQTRNIQALMTL